MHHDAQANTNTKLKKKKRLPLPTDDYEVDEADGESEVKMNLPAVVLPKRISKIRTNGKMRSILGDSAEDIQQLLEIGENDSATTLIHKKLLQSLIDLLPYAEHNVRQSKGVRGVYQINSLISSVREIVIDLQSTQDRGQIGVNLVERVIRPAFLDIGMNIVQEYATVLTEAKDLMAPEDYKVFKGRQTESRARLAEFIQTSFGKVKDEATSFMQR